jgi:integrase
MGVTAGHVSRDGVRWVLDVHKTDREGEARVVYLSPAMQGLTKKLVALYPEGPLFRSTRRFGGVRRPWTRNGIRCRFKRLREKVARLREAEEDPDRRAAIPDLAGLTSYVLRHTYATDALTGGLPVPVVSALLGHKSMKMVDEHYNHTDRATQVLKDAAARAAQARPATPGSESGTQA